MDDRRGTFTLSLDVELAWGSWQRPHIPSTVFAQGAECALAVERISRECRFPFTWAVVSALHDLTFEELGSVGDNESVAVLRPGLGPFKEPLPTVGMVRRNPDAWLAPRVVEALRNSPVEHDLGSHTYFHSTPSTAEGLIRDLEASRAALGGGLASLVYPRDRVAFEHTIPQAGLTNYRAPGTAWYFREGKARGLGRVNHTLDQAIGRTAPGANVHGKDPVAISSSTILTLRTGIRRRIPYRVIRRRFVRPLRAAVSTGGLYHLYTHPWNLALPSSDALMLLEDICQEAKQLVDAGDLRVRTMAALASDAEGTV